MPSNKAACKAFKKHVFPMLFSTLALALLLLVFEHMHWFTWADVVTLQIAGSHEKLENSNEKAAALLRTAPVSAVKIGDEVIVLVLDDDVLKINPGLRRCQQVQQGVGRRERGFYFSEGNGSICGGGRFFLLASQEEQACNDARKQPNASRKIGRYWFCHVLKIWNNSPQRYFLGGILQSLIRQNGGVGCY